MVGYFIACFAFVKRDLAFIYLTYRKKYIICPYNNINKEKTMNIHYCFPRALYNETLLDVNKQMASITIRDEDFPNFEEDLLASMKNARPKYNKVHIRETLELDDDGELASDTTILIPETEKCPDCKEKRCPECLDKQQPISLVLRQYDMGGER
jgi:hypothetical protein